MGLCKVPRGHVRAGGSASWAGWLWAGRQETETWTCKMRLKYLFGVMDEKGRGQRKKDRTREKEREKRQTTRVHTPKEKRERGQDGDERSKVTGSGRGLPLKGTKRNNN